MHWLRGLIIVFALVEGGWLAFDGAHALRTGDYVTPRSGVYAGQLGPWAKLVGALGVDPRSTSMKVIHLVIGVVWIISLACFALQLPGAWWAMMLCAMAGLWYLPFGTLLSLIQIAILLLPVVRTTPT